MRPAEFTTESIISAGQDLHAAGRAVTGFAIRQKIGGGNPARLKQVWEEHVSSQSVAKAEPVAELPVEVADEVAAVSKALTERLATLAVELNDKAVRTAERRVAEVIRTAGEQREFAERELADAAQTVDDLESQMEEARATASGLEKLLADVQAVSQAQAVELAQVRERLTLTEQAAKAAAEEHAAEIDCLNAGFEAERSRYQSELAGQKKAFQDIVTERDAARAELASVKAKAEAAVQMHQEQRKQAAAEASRVAERLTKAHAERDGARKEAATAREEAAQLRGQVEALQAQAADLMRALAPRK
ncbi:DNA-binding protein [Thiobacillus sp.]|uniref:DNA-binding protein n=1 Tax=Thiobacillus sp. TaxID=924 RepID=UPI0025D86D32|nr:DNA-binding protein [Thiobacillus sp.]